MKKEYQKPVVQFIELRKENVLTASDPADIDGSAGPLSEELVIDEINPI